MNFQSWWKMKGEATKIPAHSAIDMFTQNGSVSDPKCIDGSPSVGLPAATSFAFFAAHEVNSGSRSQS
jgi:hypothetical protein